jgi:pSer/pThr/pTyr-binding forkhead associated (FHA) protein
VSRKHCAITLGAAGATLIDNGSSNGTRLNGAPLQPGMEQSVYAGDELGIGAGAYRLE